MTSLRTTVTADFEPEEKITPFLRMRKENGQNTSNVSDS